MDPSSAPPPLDLEAVRRRLAETTAVGDLTLERETAGRTRVQSVVSDGTARWIVRRPRTEADWEGLIHEDDVLVRLCDRLPVPHVVVAATGRDETAFDVISHIEGLRLGERLPPELPRTAHTRHDVSEAIVEALVRIHSIEPGTVAPAAADVLPLDAALAGWQGRLAATGAEPAGEIAELLERLGRAIPPPAAPGLVHGSYHMGRVILDREDPRRAVGIIGWSQAAVGDPRLDLGLLMAAWVEDRDEAVTSWLPKTALTSDDGFFSRATVAHEYASRSGVDLRDLEWFVAAGYLRLIVGAAERGSADALSAMAPMAREALARAAHSGLAGLSGP